MIRDVFKVNLISTGEYLIEKGLKNEEDIFNIEIEQVN